MKSILKLLKISILVDILSDSVNLLTCNFMRYSYTMEIKVFHQKLIFFVKFLSKSNFKDIKFLPHSFAFEFLNTWLN